MKAEPILQIENTILGEGPVWDHRTDTLWWVDIAKGALHAFDPETDSNKTFSMRQMLGAAVPCEGKGLILAMQHGFALFDPEQKKWQLISDPESNQPLNRFNDGKCDPAGRFWAGTMMIDEPRKPAGSLYCLDHAHQIAKKLSGLVISNGLAWNKAADKMYFIDTMTHKLQSFHYDLSSGDIEKEKDVIFFGELLPDGMCMDEEDHLWIAFYGSGLIACFDPQTGKQLERIEVPAECTTSCAFGGKDLDTLFITSAAKKGDPLGGTLFALKPGIKGRPANFFKGNQITFAIGPAA